MGSAGGISPPAAVPRYLVRDRDRMSGPAFKDRVEGMGIAEVLTAPRSPWQNPFAERVIGSIRRECLDLSVPMNTEMTAIAGVSLSVG